ncbi:MAG: DivIVA domain-containing protein [Mycoplasma sp.]
MSQNIINFLEAVINKKFTAKHQGYDPNQVDETLDLIVNNVNNLLDDWNKLCDKYEALEQKYQISLEEKQVLKKEKAMLEGKIASYESAGVSSAMMNERITKLELERKYSENEPEKIKEIK